VKILFRIALGGFVLALADAAWAAIFGPHWIFAFVFVLLAPAGMWYVIDAEQRFARVVNDKPYVPIEDPRTFADAVNNLNGAVGNLTREVARAVPWLGRRGGEDE